MFVTPKVIETFYPNLKLTILTLHFITISSVIVVLFNQYFTLYDSSELRMGSAIANPDDMI